MAGFQNVARGESRQIVNIAANGGLDCGPLGGIELRILQRREERFERIRPRSGGRGEPIEFRGVGGEPLSYEISKRSSLHSHLVFEQRGNSSAVSLDEQRLGVRGGTPLVKVLRAIKGYLRFAVGDQLPDGCFGGSYGLDGGFCQMRNSGPTILGEEGLYYRRECVGGSRKSPS